MLWTLLRSYFMQGFESSRSCSRHARKLEIVLIHEMWVLLSLNQF